MEKSEKGFIPVMLTPFSDDGRIDYKALELLTAHYLDAGVKGLFANCLSSEMFELNNEERISLTAKVVKIADRTVPVVATGTFGGPIAQQAEFVKRIYDTGIDAVILITSLIAEESDTDEQFNEKVMQLLQLTPSVPVGFYECPLPFKRVLSAAQLGSFVATGRVTYHKDTSLDINQVRAKLAVTQQPGFGLYDAYMVHALASLRAGSAGLSCIQGNFFPELIVWLCKNYDKPELDAELNALQDFLILHMDVMHDVYPYAAKYALQKQGLPISTFTRRDVGHFSPANAREIEQLYADYNILQQRIGI
ncbi:dihydrodipicolinate synthase family protein [Pedobacter sp. MC2016-15]|uniref:dihydrodipicolinate synthase family protein n=1 Tax=Pedobacter sp. MC2016-15 TaxID=2994473 RepID=UPI0022485A74|nr:dihydrodipicolinate synthase family protein [Pedobacter sp. MC2016-15]MCX2480433.1 dihydrodipicolinate synthase family protein [Pedobacter sp. MC2016-15]